MRSAFIAKHRHIWPVSWLCEVLDVSRSGFHAWLTRPISAREIHDAKRVTVIETSFMSSDRTYGARRVWRDVLEEGLACGLHRIERLMRINAFGGAAQTPRKAEGRWGTLGHRRHATSRLTGQTRSGWPTSPISGPRKAGFMWPSCWTCFPGTSSAGP